MTKFKMLLAAALLSAGVAVLPAMPAHADSLGVTVGDGGVNVQYGDGYGRGYGYGDQYRRGRLFVRPGAAEPGDVVTLIGRGLPPGARLTLVGGRDPSRYITLRNVRSDYNGRVFTRIRVPDWVRPGRVFLALTVPGGRVLAISQPVQILGNGDGGGNERISVTGEILDSNATCPRLDGDDGRVYALSGDLREFEAGDRVRVTGELADSSICGSRRTIDIERIREAQ